jgi:pimeloyl-ACP methyl ester carboxylesterase
MRGFVRFLIAGLKLLILALLGALALTIRYLWSTPQPLRSNIPGDPRIYKWTHGAIFYTVAGPADATPLVLLHAPTIGGSSYEMRHLIAGLAQCYRVYVPDLLGFGLADRPRLDYTAETYVQLCQDFVADVIAQPALLLGSGLSCNYSVAVAARRPDLCRGVILLSPRSLFAGSERMLPRWLVLLIEHPLTALPFYSLFTTRTILRIIVTWPYAIKDTTGGTVDHVQVSSEELASIFANAHQFGAEHAALAWMAGKLNLDVLPQFEQLTLPILTIWHRRTFKSISATSGQPAHMLSERMIVMESSGPRIHAEQPAQVVANILAWQAAQEPANIATAAEQHSLTEGEASNSTTIPGVQPEDIISAETPLETVHGGQSPEPVNETHEEPENVVDGRGRVLQPGPYHQPEAYCVRCKQKRTMQDPHKIVTKNGRSALEGTCPVCSTRLFRFIKG